MARKNKNFKEGLIEAIKVAGQMIIDNAEDIAGKTEFMSYLDISVNFDPENGSIPELNIYRSHLPTHEQLEHINNAFNGEKPDEQEKDNSVVRMTNPKPSDVNVDMPNWDKTCEILYNYDPISNTTVIRCSACGTEREYDTRVTYHARYDTFRCPDCGAKILSGGKFDD